MKIYNSTILIDLEHSEEDIWKSLHKVTRNDIRRAKKKGVVVIKDHDLKYLKDCHRLYCLMCERNLIPQPSLEQFKKKIEKAKKGVMLVALFKNKAVSFMYIGEWDLKPAIGALKHNATDFNYKELQPNSLLYWDTVLTMKDMGFKYCNLAGLDLGTGDAHLKNINRFKRRWNGVEIIVPVDVSLFEWIYWKFLRRFRIIRHIKYKWQMRS